MSLLYILCINALAITPNWDKYVDSILKVLFKWGFDSLSSNWQ